MAIAATAIIVVADSWQGRGIGKRLLAKLADVARRRGVKRLYEDPTLARASLHLGR